MEVFFLTFAIFGFAMAGMSIGLFFGKPAIKRTCAREKMSDSCICKEEGQPCKKLRNLEAAKLT